MPRDIPVGNGQMLVTFDQHYQIRDLYFPHVGQENHVGGNACHFGVYASIPGEHSDRRKRRLYWSSQEWSLALGYQDQTLSTQVGMRHPMLRLELSCCDVVDYHRPILVRRIELTNDCDQARVVHLFHHNNFSMYNSRVGDTAYFDPLLRCLIHYRENRYLMAGWYADGEQRIDEYATGAAGYSGAEGTFRDAEDGSLGNNPIAQGAVDSTMMLRVRLQPHGKQVVYLFIGAGQSTRDLNKLHRFLHREGPQGIIDRTQAYWKLWLGASHVRFDPQASDPALQPSEKVRRLFERSLLVVRSQIDNSGAIIAANDTDIMQFSRDTYSYLWPRDGAMVAAALDLAGFPDVARSFYSLCERLIDERGFFLHKYNPDGSPASSWHPWVSLGRPQLPIQEDETALVLWALWAHFETYRDIEFVRPLWVNLITRAADFLVRFRDPRTNLPLPSYDLWEERWGVHAFTVASVHAGLEAAAKFADAFGDHRRATEYERAAAEIRSAFEEHFWSPEHGRFLRRLVPLDHERTAGHMAQVLAGRTPTRESVPPALGQPVSNSGNGHTTRAASRLAQRDQLPVAFERDPVIDSSMYAIFALGLLPVEDDRVERTMQAIERELWVNTEVGGLARYTGDYYHRVSNDLAAVPGNPWFITTLWLAQWRIARATNLEELAEALPILEWVAEHALPSGTLAEQVHPHTNAPLSVSPLTWSHATLVATVCDYQRRLKELAPKQQSRISEKQEMQSGSPESRKPGTTGAEASPLAAAHP